MVLTIMIGVGLLVASIVAAAVSHGDQAFRDRFPPITDDEFLARCPPGTNPAIALRVRQIVSEQMGVEYGRIYPTTRFVEDLGAG